MQYMQNHQYKLDSQKDTVNNDLHKNNINLNMIDMQFKYHLMYKQHILQDKQYINLHQQLPNNILNYIKYNYHYQHMQNNQYDKNNKDYPLNKIHYYKVDKIHLNQLKSNLDLIYNDLKIKMNNIHLLLNNQYKIKLYLMFLNNIQNMFHKFLMIEDIEYNYFNTLYIH